MTDEFEQRARAAADAVRKGAAAEAHLSTLAPDMLAARAKSRSRRTATRVVTVATTVFVIATGALGVSQLADKKSDGSGSNAGNAPFALVGDLKPFTACDEALQYFKDQAPAYYLKQAERGGPRNSIDSSMRADAPASASAEKSYAEGATPTTTPTSGATAMQDSTTPEYSTTNVQERGVDEPDILKTDGKRVFAIASGRVFVLNATDGKPERKAELDVKLAQSMLLRGDRLVVFSAHNTQGIRGDGQPVPAIVEGPFMPGNSVGAKTTISVFDVRDVAAPKKLRSVEIDGAFVDARMVGSVVRSVTEWTPEVKIPSPIYENGNISESSKQALRESIASSHLQDWIPQMRLLRGDGSQERAGELVSCDRLARPSTFSGINTVGVMSFDLAADEFDAPSEGVVAGGERVYANEKNVYITSAEWKPDQGSTTTSIHKFSVAPGDKTGLSMTYRGSGAVEGELLNSYAMSERDGILRIASTYAGTVGWVNRRWVREGIVTTLAERDGKLVQVGRLGGLGKQDAESIRAVRFIDDKGYVVTFRQTDPLFVIDLRDASTPKVAGKLKIPGFSGYLHPVGKDRLIGVGQSEGQGMAVPNAGSSMNSGATNERAGVSTVAPRIAPIANGVQFRLFDVSDPSKPRVVDTQTFGNGTAVAQFDPKAFLYWAPRNLVIAPTSYTQDAKSPNAMFQGLVLLTPESQELKETGRIAYANNENSYAQVTRTMVIGNNVFSLSDSGIQANSLDSHALLGQAKLG